MPALSLVVITLNAEQHLAACLASARDIVQEILVVDSGSTDRTVSIAESFGARVLQQPFLGFRDQKQFAVDHARHDHILVMDADESLSPELAASILTARDQWTADAWIVNRLNHFAGRPVRHGGWYPDRIVRLFDRRACQYGPATIHESIHVAPHLRVGKLEGDLLHDAYRSREELFAKQRRYSRLAAAELVRKGKTGSWIRVLAKPVYRFFKEYLLDRGFLDGRIGWTIACSSAAYVYWRELALHQSTH
ncbi:MAG: glycosyltransferase family 2 protein [Lewinellaceae bacterium]|nr:glycosyltransferase family 2 protein [Saprospiraceae bacterium]MCB9312394.1 glycosyltransferase family 2 protein [Lewinellaceae bacterium]HRW75027.1 glycosyltransferase family 2 protein [Saprospiraceae bacterium]